MSQLLHDIVTLAALESPTKIAFTDSVNSLTYQDLDHRSNQLAHLLVEQSLQPCLLYTSPSPRDRTRSRMPSSA